MHQNLYCLKFAVHIHNFVEEHDRTPGSTTLCILSHLILGISGDLRIRIHIANFYAPPFVHNRTHYSNFILV